MVRLLTAAAVSLPALGGMIMTLLLRRVRFSIAYYVTLMTSSASAISLLMLLPHVDSHAVLSVDWMPGAGTMGVALGATSLWAALVTSVALIVVLLSQASDQRGFPAASGVLMLLTLTTANVAFLADHFLARYVALEVVALCVALALLVDARQPTRFRPAWTSYLILRLGDAGLLTAIFVLLRESGTLNIKKALEAGATLEGATLAYAVAGFLLAVWVKLGGWPFHVWSQQGRPASLATRAWLYGTVMPNLGLYLLYRVSALLPLVQPLQQAMLWVGAVGAAVAALIMLTQDDRRTALVYLGAAQAGVAIFAAASGVSSAIWLSVVLLTPVRVLLFLAADCAQIGFARWHRGAVGALSALAGLALLLYNVLMTWWAKQASAPLDALLVTEVGVALCAVWASKAASRLPTGQYEKEQVQGDRLRLAVLGLVGITVLAGVSRLAPLVGYLTMSGGVSPLLVPSVSALFRHVVTMPAMWAVIVLGWGLWQLQRRSGQEPILPLHISRPIGDLEETLAQAARTLQAVVEVGLLEQTLAMIVRVVKDGSRIVYRVVEQDGLDTLLAQVTRTVIAVAKGLYHVLEGQGLEELQQRAAQTFMGRLREAYRVLEQEGIEALQRRAAQAVMDGARTTYGAVEEESSAGILRPVVRVALGWGYTLQRWHTGRLRHNLMWVLGTLLVIMVVLALVVW